MDVTRDEEIDAAIAIVVGPGCAGAEATSGDAGFISDVFEFAIAEIVVERIAAESADVDILPAVVVKVGDGDAHAPSFAGQAGLFGDVGELQVASAGITILMVERNQRVAALAIALDGGTVHGDDVELAVVVAVDQTDAAAHGFHDVLFVRR